MQSDTGADFRYLDFALMEDTFRACGLFLSDIVRKTGEVSL